MLIKERFSAAGVYGNAVVALKLISGWFLSSLVSTNGDVIVVMMLYQAGESYINNKL